MSADPERFAERDRAVRGTYKRDTVPGYRHQVISPDPTCPPYLERWIFGFGIPGREALFSLRLHHFFSSDEPHLHDHPFAFWTLVLRGSYEDWVACSWCDGRGGRDYAEWVDMPSGPTPVQGRRPCAYCHGSGQMLGTRMTPGRIRFRPALHKHRVVTTGCWTLVLSGPKIRDWGFDVPGIGWLRQREYFRRFGGHAACE